MKVYLSSTLDDLRPERQAVKDALGGECIVVESYTADERSTRESCLDDVEKCDLYIGIIGLRYGFVPPNHTFSITHLEYERARKCKVPTLVFIKDAGAVPYSQSDAGTDEHPKERIESLRDELNSAAEDTSRPAVFKTPGDLKAHVLKAYFHLSGRLGPLKPKRIEGRPFPGLRAFLPIEADRFCGREAEKAELVTRILARSDRFVAVIGPSGSGKSSLVYAGLIPALTATSVVAGVRWVPASFSPCELGDDPFQSLAVALRNALPGQGLRVPQLVQRFRESPADIGKLANEAFGDEPTHAELVLFVDQFEEIFATRVSSDTRRAFFQLLAAGATSQSVRVIVAMRSDFYSQWPQDEQFIALLGCGHFPIGTPGPAALEKMIVGPASAAGLAIAPHLIQRILDDTGTAPGALALAEYTLSQLYDRREPRGESQVEVLTETAYDAIGGVAGAIENLAEQAVRLAEETLREVNATLDEEDWSRLFLAIASIEEKGDELAIVRRRASKSDLAGGALTLSEHLVDKRILVSREGARGSLGVYEVAHEAVFSNWKRFRDWYDRYADDLALCRQSERAATYWQNAGRLPALRWGWERQRSVLDATRKLCHLSTPISDPEFVDLGIAVWRMLEGVLRDDSIRSFLRPEPLELLDELAMDKTAHYRREEVGLRLNQLDDPRRGAGLGPAGLPDILWIDIPPGKVTLNNETRDTFEVKPFRFARYPITWAQYRVFLNASDGYAKPAWWQGLKREEKPGDLRWAFGNYPAVNISWFDSVAYCRWLSASLGLDIRLPTEWEWQWAAVADRKHEYPWPGEWNPARANIVEAGVGRTVAVGLYPLGRSPFGLDDLVGNVSEWCLNEYANPRDTSMKPNASRAVRGGSWSSLRIGASSRFRNGTLPANRNDNRGFRVVCGALTD